MNTFVHLERLLEANTQISVLRFFEFSFNNKIQNVLSELTTSESKCIDRIVNTKKESGRSFWETYLEEVIDTKSIEKRIFASALRHNENGIYKHVLARDVLSFVKSCIDKNVALNSLVILSDGSEMHIPLLDFKIPVASGNVFIVKEALKKLKLTGFILDSGKSFHFVGNKLISKSALIELLARFTLLYPISDKSWAAHQIIEQSASLRITPKNGALPSIIDIVDD